MAATEELVAAHYGARNVLTIILDALARAGIDPENLRPEDLAVLDELHTGGHLATDALLEQIEIPPGTRVLDIGSGIGGPSRHLAARFGAEVVGVDLTEEFVAAARHLTRLVRLDDRVTFLQGSATGLPVPEASADLALLLHVGMNIPDKPAVFRAAARALRPGGRFVVFEIMRGANASELVFPLPWAMRPETSFVAAPEVYRAAAEAAGFRLLAERDRRDFALEFFHGLQERIAREGMPPLGTHLLMGETAPQKIRNVVANLEAGRIAPREMIFERV